MTLRNTQVKPAVVTSMHCGVSGLVRVCGSVCKCVCMGILVYVLEREERERQTNKMKQIQRDKAKFSSCSVGKRETYRQVS